MEVDHINLDPTDDRPENLREATRAQNAFNTARNDNATGHKGVYRYVNKGVDRGFTAQFRNQHLGCFKTEEEARQAYRVAAIDGAGQFARYA
jgi:hypothetical protein